MSDVGQVKHEENNHHAPIQEPWLWEDQKSQLGGADAGVVKADLIDPVQCPKGQSWILSSAGGDEKQTCSIWINK